MASQLQLLQEHHRALIQAFLQFQRATDGSAKRSLVLELFRQLALHVAEHQSYLKTWAPSDATDVHPDGPSPHSDAMGSLPQVKTACLPEDTMSAVG